MNIFKILIVIIVTILLSVSTNALNNTTKANEIYCIDTAHPSWYIGSSNNKVRLRKYIRTEEWIKWKLSLDLWTFTNKPDLYEIKYSSENKPINWYLKTTYYKNTQFNWISQNCMFASSSFEELKNNINIAIQNWETRKYPSNFSWWDLNRDDNFWTIFTPKKWFFYTLSNLEDIDTLDDLYIKDDESKFPKMYNPPKTEDKTKNINFSVNWNDIDCKEISRVQTDFYGNPKWGSIDYFWNSWNFMYTNTHKWVPVLKTAIQTDNSYFSNTFSQKYSHSYWHSNNGNNFAYRSDNEITIQPWFKSIDTSNLWSISFIKFYKKWILFTAKKDVNKKRITTLYYSEITNNKKLKYTILSNKYEYINKLTVSDDLEHYAFAGKINWAFEVIIDWKRSNWWFSDISDIIITKTFNKLIYSFKKWKNSWIYKDNKIYIENKNTKNYSRVWSMIYLPEQDKIAYIKSIDSWLYLVIWKEEKVFNLNTNNYWDIYLNENNNSIYTTYWIKTENPRVNWYKYWYLSINLDSFERKDYWIYDEIKNISFFENWTHIFWTKKWIFMNWINMLVEDSHIINWFSTGIDNNFYFTKYEEKIISTQIKPLSFFTNYNCTISNNNVLVKKYSESNNIEYISNIESLKYTLFNQYKINTIKYEELIRKKHKIELESVIKKIKALKSTEKYIKYPLKAKTLIDYIELVIKNKIKNIIKVSLLETKSKTQETFYVNEELEFFKYWNNYKIIFKHAYYWVLQDKYIYINFDKDIMIDISNEALILSWNKVYITKWWYHFKKNK